MGALKMSHQRNVREKETSRDSSTTSCFLLIGGGHRGIGTRTRRLKQYHTTLNCHGFSQRILRSVLC